MHSKVRWLKLQKWVLCKLACRPCTELYYYLEQVVGAVRDGRLWEYADEGRAEAAVERAGTLAADDKAHAARYASNPGDGHSMDGGRAAEC